jgi:thiamine biosynthesis lipoprotein
MGFPVSLIIGGDDTAAMRAVDRAFAVLDAADARFSRFRPDSELSLLSRGELEETTMSADMLEVLGRAEQYRVMSGGAFDVRHDGGLDTDGIVKGWAVQRAAETLRDAGVSDFCLNAGGDVVVAGRPEPGRPWHAAIRSPWHPTTIAAVVALGDGSDASGRRAIATSGRYERGEHLIDARDGSSADGFASVSVLHGSLAVADVAATAVFALGASGPAWAAETLGCAVVTIDRGGVLDVVGDMTWAHGDRTM